MLPPALAWGVSWPFSLVGYRGRNESVPGSGGRGSSDWLPRSDGDACCQRGSGGDIAAAAAAEAAGMRLAAPAVPGRTPPNSPPPSPSPS